MIEPRDQLCAWIDILLDNARTPLEHLQTTQDWYAGWISMLGVDESRRDLALDLGLGEGKAVSPLTAARCLCDSVRTVRFLQAAEAALARVSPSEPIRPTHVIEAGCGPFAPIALALAVRHPPSRVQVSLIDANPSAVALLETLIDQLGVSDSVRACRVADVTQVDLSVDPPDIVVCELIQRGLRDEPQVAATRRLASFMQPGGVFLPERIDLHAGYFNAHRHFTAQLEGRLDRTAITDLGPVFRLDARETDAASPVRLDLPPTTASAPLHIFTRIQVLDDMRLDDFDAAITLPEALPGAETLAASGGAAIFEYVTGASPRLCVRPAVAGLDVDGPAGGHLVDADRS